MASKPLRSQLNQIRAWVRQGRTDAWIAHQLEVSGSELREFRRRHGLNAEDEGGEAVDLRDEIEAEIEAATLEEERVAEEAGPAEEETSSDDNDEASAEDEDEETDADGTPKRRRRRRRRKGRPGANLEASFDHGTAEGYGLWMDPAVAEDPIYAEHWKDHRPVVLTVEPDRITIRRVESNGNESSNDS